MKSPCCSEFVMAYEQLGNDRNWTCLSFERRHMLKTVAVTGADHQSGVILH